MTIYLRPFPCNFKLNNFKILRKSNKIGSSNHHQRHHQQEIQKLSKSSPEPQPPNPCEISARKVHKDVQTPRRRFSTLKIQPNAPGEGWSPWKEWLGLFFGGEASRIISRTKVIKVFCWDKNSKLLYRFVICDPPKIRVSTERQHGVECRHFKTCLPTKLWIRFRSIYIDQSNNCTCTNQKTSQTSPMIVLGDILPVMCSFWTFPGIKESKPNGPNTWWLERNKLLHSAAQKWRRYVHYVNIKHKSI